MKNHLYRLGCLLWLIAAVTGKGQAQDPHVDTIDTTAVICPGATLTWYGKTFGENLFR